MSYPTLSRTLQLLVFAERKSKDTPRYSSGDEIGASILFFVSLLAVTQAHEIRLYVTTASNSGAAIQTRENADSAGLLEEVRFSFKAL